MDFRRLGTFLIVGGVTVMAAAFAWWMTFYSSILRELARAPGAPASGNVFDLFSCFYSSKDVCGFIAGFARVVGRTPYEPMVAWLGLAALVAGLAMRVAAKPGSGRA